MPHSPQVFFEGNQQYVLEAPPLTKVSHGRRGEFIIPPPPPLLLPAFPVGIILATTTGIDNHIRNVYLNEVAVGIKVEQRKRPALCGDTARATNSVDVVGLE